MFSQARRAFRLTVRLGVRIMTASLQWRSLMAKKKPVKKPAKTNPAKPKLTKTKNPTSKAKKPAGKKPAPPATPPPVAPAAVAPAPVAAAPAPVIPAPVIPAPVVPPALSTEPLRYQINQDGTIDCLECKRFAGITIGTIAKLTPVEVIGPHYKPLMGRPIGISVIRNLSLIHHGQATIAVIRHDQTVMHRPV
jgi:hypothetical protein